MVRRVLERRKSPSILTELEKSTPKLKFIADCFQYSSMGQRFIEILIVLG